MIEPGATVGERMKRARGDLILALALLAIVALMIVPVPTPLLDVLIAANLALAVVMLLVSIGGIAPAPRGGAMSISVGDGLAFTTMPTLLLCTTLYRLALNVSSTRLILLQADAGRVIRAFGDFVVRGDYAVGAAVFFILTLIQYVVVARGSERVAEVGARFSLDAMPGKQLAIDADLRAGALDPEGARAARRTLERESQFYGAMDGAMKFVKGDAIAGIVITFVNVVAGLGIGVGMRGMSAVESLRTYGLLTIGDGLVCQIPSLLISTGAGLVVTRVAAREEHASLASDVARQLFGQAHVLALGALFLAFLAIVPGLPAPPFLLLALALAAAAFARHRAQTRDAAGLEPRFTRAGESTALDSHALVIAVGTELCTALEARGAVHWAELVATLRNELGERLGVLLPEPRVREERALAPRAFELRLREMPLARAELAKERIDDAFAEQLAALLRKHAGELIDLDTTQALLAALEKSAPAIVRNSVPKPVPLRLLCEVLRRLLAEGVSVRPLAAILETLAEAGGERATSAVLVDRVRLRLGRQIAFERAREGTLVLHPIDPLIEDVLRDAAEARGAGFGLALPPDQARDIVLAIERVVRAEPDAPPTLVTQPDVRAALRALLECELPEVAVLSYAELPNEMRVERRGAIRVG